MDRRSWFEALLALPWLLVAANAIDFGWFMLTKRSSKRMDAARSRFVFALVVAALAGFFLLCVHLCTCEKTDAAEPAPAASIHLALGNPSSASVGDRLGVNLLLVKPQYALSYNRDKATANWCAWHLCKKDFGRADRVNDFRADDQLPPDWLHVAGNAYDGTGFDSGHLCPSGDRSRTHADNAATFLMSNMVAQAPRNNRVVWRSLEEATRAIASSGKELYIYAGPFGEGGTGSKGFKRRIDASITVPRALWKVLLVLDDKEGDDAKRVTKETPVFAVVIPNNEKVVAQWQGYRVTVDDVETLTGFDFFSCVSPAIQKVIEARVLPAWRMGAREN